MEDTRSTLPEPPPPPQPDDNHPRRRFYRPLVTALAKPAVDGGELPQVACGWAYL